MVQVISITNNESLIPIQEEALRASGRFFWVGVSLQDLPIQGGCHLKPDLMIVDRSKIPHIIDAFAGEYGDEYRFLGTIPMILIANYPLHPQTAPTLPLIGRINIGTQFKAEEFWQEIEIIQLRANVGRDIAPPPKSVARPKFMRKLDKIAASLFI